MQSEFPCEFEGELNWNAMSSSKLQHIYERVVGWNRKIKTGSATTTLFLLILRQMIFEDTYDGNWVNTTREPSVQHTTATLQLQKQNSMGLVFIKTRRKHVVFPLADSDSSLILLCFPMNEKCAFACNTFIMKQFLWNCIKRPFDVRFACFHSSIGSFVAWF